MKKLRLSFTLDKQPAYIMAAAGGRDQLTFTAYGDLIFFQVYYDLNPTPLTLQSEARTGDRVELTLSDNLISLYVNGELRDEEWPAGKRLFDLGSAYKTGLTLRIDECEEPEELKPAVLGTFQNAEGWRPEANVFVGDCMPYVKDGRYHVIYLKDRHRHRSKWGKGAHQWAHISTADFINWDIHPMAVEITKPEEGSICTGSWIAVGETEYLFYTVRSIDRSPAKFGRSISRDGFHFEKDEGFHLTLSDRYDAPTARDPKVIRGEDGLFHMFLTTSLIKERKGCLAHLVSQDLDFWTEEEPIYVSPDGRQPECPDYISFNGRYYLLCSTDGKARYLYSDKPFGPWRQPESPVIPCGGVPKGAVWNGNIVFTGFRTMDGAYAGTMTFATANTGEQGELKFI